MKRFQVLLKAKVPVSSQEYIELLLRLFEQLAISDTGPTSSANGTALMADQRATKTPIKAFVN